MISTQTFAGTKVGGVLVEASLILKLGFGSALGLGVMVRVGL